VRVDQQFDQRVLGRLGHVNPCHKDTETRKGGDRLPF